MAASDWTRIEDLFEKAIKIADLDERSLFVAENACDDAELRSALYSLLENDSRENSLLDHPAFSMGERLLANSGSEEIFGGLEFAHYRMIRLIGRGGMGVVYLAEDDRLNRKVALKILPASLLDHSAAARFRQEARLASKISHPSVAQVYEFGQKDGRHFIAIEYIDGWTLRELISDGNLTVRQILSFALAIASALKAAHDIGIAHRDIKPENIAVTKNGTIKVLDFGLAKALPDADARPADTVLETLPGLLMGTSAYMSPEQVRGDETDRRTDIWSFGVVLFEMLTGVRPFAGETSSDVRAAILRGQPLRLSPANSFRRVIEKCLEKEPANRYLSIAEPIEELARIKLADHTSTLDVAVTEKTNLVTEDSDEAIAGGNAGSRRAITRFVLARKWPLLAVFGSLMVIISFAFIYNGYRLPQTAGGESLRTRKNAIGMEFVYIPAGEFTMGSTQQEVDEALNDCTEKYGENCDREWFTAEMPKHNVKITDPFWIGIYEVTQGQWQAVMGGNPSFLKDCGENCPVEQVVWEDTQIFLDKLNAMNDGYFYSLPTEAQWEYAARARTTTAFAFGDSLNSTQANFNGDYPFASTKGTNLGMMTAVGTYEPNAWGLYDMHGNALEWVQDVYQNSYTGLPTDGTANVNSNESSVRVLRGGSWGDLGYNTRSATRYKDSLSLRADLRGVGFRVAARPRASEIQLADPSTGVRKKVAGTIRKNSLGMEFVYIPPGEFVMGSDDGPANERPAHKVTIAEGFWMSKYEVTDEQFHTINTHYPNLKKDCLRCPIEDVTWFRAKEIVWMLNDKNDGLLYSFPTEAEWEYAARAGTTGNYYGKLDEIAWILDNSGNKPQPVGGKQPNDFGLYDMLGNSWEWCEDIYKPNYNGASADGSANVSSGNPQFRVLRGGSAGNDAFYARVTSRLRAGPGLKFVKNDFSIRLVARER